MLSHNWAKVSFITFLSFFFVQFSPSDIMTHICSCREFVTLIWELKVKAFISFWQLQTHLKSQNYYIRFFFEPLYSGLAISIKICLAMLGSVIRNWDWSIVFSFLEPPAALIVRFSTLLCNLFSYFFFLSIVSYCCAFTLSVLRVLSVCFVPLIENSVN